MHVSLTSSTHPRSDLYSSAVRHTVDDIQHELTAELQIQKGVGSSGTSVSNPAEDG